MYGVLINAPYKADADIDGYQFEMSIVPCIGDSIKIKSKWYIVVRRGIDSVTSHVELFVHSVASHGRKRLTEY